MYVCGKERKEGKGGGGGGKGAGGEYMYVKSNWMCLQVEKGDFVAAERVLEQATEGKPHYLTACTSQLPLFFVIFIISAEGFLDDFISQQPLEARWTLLESKMTGVGECGCDCVGREGGKGGGRGKEERGEHCFIVSSVDGEQAVRPGMRGGHQMSIDPVRGKKTMHVANHHILSQISLLPLSSSSSCPLLPFSSSPPSPPFLNQSCCTCMEGGMAHMTLVTSGSLMSGGATGPASARTRLLW